MADVRGASGVPAVAAFGGLATPTPSTPIYVDSATGDLYVLISEAVKKVASSSVTTAIAAAGANQAAATALAATINAVGTVAADTGVRLSASWYVGNQQIVFNGGANPLKVYPHSGGKVNSLATNAAMILAVNTVCVFWLISSTQWIGVLSA